MEIKVERVKSIEGMLEIPGDKSISHRSIMFGSLAEGKTYIKGFLSSDDCLSTIGVFKELGVEINQTGKTEYLIEGKGLFGLKKPLKDLYVGNSGTTIRLMSGILAGQKFNSIITGDSSILRRPMGRIINPLRLMGANILGKEDNFAPLNIVGSTLNGITYESQISSAQVKSAILLAGLFANGNTTYMEPYLSRNHSEIMLKNFGADISYNNNKIIISSRNSLYGQEITVPGDFSSASFFIAAALIVPNSKLIIHNVGLNPTRTGFLDAIKLMNGKVTIIDLKSVNGELIGDVSIEHSDLKGIELDKDWIPRIIDELPILAVLATQAEGITKIKDAEELRVKETDRISAITSELKKIGIKIEELEDGFIIVGKQEISGGIVTTYNDHRIGMAMSIAGLIAKNGIVIENADVVKISYPNFYEDLATILKY